MLRYFKKKDGSESKHSTNVIETSNSKNTQSKDQGGDFNIRDEAENFSKYRKIDLDTLPADPGERKKIDDFHPSVRDEIRRAYLQKGPCQPRNHSFQERKIGGRSRRFNAIWFDSYKYWLEYSITEESAFCLCCYLFKPEIKNQGGHDSFVSGGFKAWNKKNRLDEHNSGNAHNLAVQKCQNLMKQAQSIASALDRQTNIVRKEYRIRLEASIDCVRFCLHQGLPFRGHDEHEDSNNKGNFLELLSFYAGKVDEVGNVVLKNAPRNSQMTSPTIQKDIVHAIATETRKAIIKDLGDDLFGILVDESRDVSCKEQMALVLRYVNNEGCVMERFIGIALVSDTAASSLKDEIVSMLSEHGLSPSRIRGQGYDGASNMRGEFNGLKTLIMRDTPSAYYIHCFAHQLQLTLVFVAKSHFDIDDFFDWVSRLLNMIGASCKRRDNLREKQAQKVAESLVNHDIDTGRGLNQERAIKRPSDTRWGSHYGSLLNIMSMYSSIIEVLEDIEKDGTLQEQRAEAHRLLGMIESFDFSFCLHLMVKILGITNDLNFALQKKDQEIVNAMSLVRVTKDKLQDMRDNDWKILMADVSLFCNVHDIVVPVMEDSYAPRRRRRAPQVSNLHHYKFDLFNGVIDMQLQELRTRFNEVNTELLLSVACLCPSNTFHAFDEEKLVKMAEFYPMEFSTVEVAALRHQLRNYIADVCQDDRFVGLKGIGELARKMVETRKHIIYHLVYLLLKLALILPVATSTVERAFSAMNLVKSNLRNRIGDVFFEDCLMTYIEKDVFKSISNDAIIDFFQKMRTRREQL